jgi:hypothetical protein
VSCSLAQVDPRFRGSYSFHHQGDDGQEDVWGSEGIAPRILISELVGGEGQLHVTVALPRGNIPGTHRIGV